MRIGAVFPQTEYPSNSAAVAEYAQHAESLGFKHILAYDHILGANPKRPGGWQGPYSHTDSFLEPLVTFSFMAAITKTIEFTTGVLVLPQRETALVAKQAAMLDVLSGGRLRLGVGIGWNTVEFEGLGKKFSNRGKRVDEQLLVMSSLWEQELVTFSGKWHQLSDVGLNPMPIQRPIPIWFGGHHENVFKRIAQFGQGWMPGFRVAEEAEPSLKKIRHYMTKAGRNPQSLGIEVRLLYGEGDVSSWQYSLEAWKKVGATHASINTMGAGFTESDQHLQAIEKFAEAVS